MAISNATGQSRTIRLQPVNAANLAKHAVLSAAPKSLRVFELNVVI
jgi:hypothetical protein